MIAVTIAGGGTGGHVFPGLALAEALTARGAAVTFVGTATGIEARVVPAAGYLLRLVPGRPLRGGGILRAVRGLVTGAHGVLRSRTLLAELRPRLVVGVGGYASVAVVLAARVRGTPTVLLEQNALPGAANRVLGRLAHRVCVGFAEALRFFPTGRAIHTGNPVRRDVASIRDRPPRDRLGVLVFGGSQGAHRLNEAMVEAVRILGPTAGIFDIVHQTGAADRDMVALGYASLGLRARVEAFIGDMAAAYRDADLAIARAGAMSCAELTAAGLPSILVPYPWAADDHQRHNAEALVAAGAAEMILDQELGGARLASLLRDILDHPERRARLAAGARAAGRPDAAERVADECLRVALAEGATLR